jgi:hypothetical protein
LKKWKFRNETQFQLQTTKYRDRGFQQRKHLNDLYEEKALYHRDRNRRGITLDAYA